MKKTLFAKLDIIAFILFVILCLGFKCAVIKQVVYTYTLIMGIALMFRKTPKTDNSCLKYFLILPFLVLAELLITVAIKNGLPAIYDSYTNNYHVSVGLISNIIEATILGPIKEEYLFRYLPNKYCKNKYFYYFVAVVFFAYLHTPGLNIILILIRIPTSFLYAYSYEKTQKLWVPVTLHILSNFIPLIFSVI